MKTTFCSRRDTITVTVPPSDVRRVRILTPGEFSTAATARCCALASSSWRRAAASEMPSAITTAMAAATTPTASRGIHLPRGGGNGRTSVTGGSWRVVAAAVSTRSLSPAGGVLATAIAILAAVSRRPCTS